MEKKISNIDVIASRGIWYVVALVSVYGLYKSLNLLWPAGGESSSSGNHRDGAVSVTTFYAVTLLRYLFFTDPPSTCYREFTDQLERLPQLLFSAFAAQLPLVFPSTYEMLTKRKYEFSISLFALSLSTGGIGLVQLSEKLRMDVGHALLTLFLACLFSLFGMVDNSYNGRYQELVWLLLGLLQLFLTCYALISPNFDDGQSWKTVFSK